MNVLAVDPGKMTGLATYADGLQVVAEMPCDSFEDWAEGWLSVTDESLVICERFVVTPRTARVDNGDLWSVQLWGVLRFLCRKYGHPFELQMPADAKAFCSDEKLRQIGWYQRGGGGHHNDALRHLVLGLARHGVHVGPE